MTSTERLKAMVAGKPVDQICQAAWWHMSLVDKNPKDLAKAIIDFTENNQFDFVKMMYNTLFFAQNFGVEVAYSQDPFVWTPRVVGQIINHPSDFKKFKPIPPTEGNLGRQLEATKIVIDHFKGEVPVIATTFTDLSFYKDIISFGNDFCVRGAIEYDRQALHDALEIINELNIQWIEALASIGVDGMFIASHYANDSRLNDEEFNEFCRPYDLKLVEAANKHMWFNMLHIHGSGRLSFHRFVDYPVQAFSWEDIWGAPDCVSFADAAKLVKDKVFIGGIEMWSDYYSSTNDREEVKERLKQRCRNAVAAVGKDRFILAPGCGAPMDIPPYRFTLQHEAVMEVTEELSI